MCDNATVYNRPETVYYKAAKKLLHTGFKMMSKVISYKHGKQNKVFFNKCIMTHTALSKSKVDFHLKAEEQTALIVCTTCES